MARRKSKAKQEQEFFQGLAGLAAIGMALGGYYVTNSIQGVVFGAILGLAIVVIIMIIIDKNELSA